MGRVIPLDPWANTSRVAAAPDTLRGLIRLVRTSFGGIRMDERLPTRLHRLRDQESGKNPVTVKAKNLLAQIRRAPMANRGRLRESDRRLRPPSQEAFR
jgi:hypothetical protein